MIINLYENFSDSLENQFQVRAIKSMCAGHDEPIYIDFSNIEEMYLEFVISYLQFKLKHQVFEINISDKFEKLLLPCNECVHYAEDNDVHYCYNTASLSHSEIGLKRENIRRLF